MVCFNKYKFALSNELIDLCHVNKIDNSNFIPRFVSPFGFEIRCGETSCVAKCGEIFKIKTGLIWHLDNDESFTLHVETSSKLLMHNNIHLLGLQIVDSELIVIGQFWPDATKIIPSNGKIVVTLDEIIGYLYVVG